MPAYEGIGAILQSQGKTDEAIAVLRKAISENAGSAIVHAGIATILLSQGKTDEAIADLRKAISENAGSAILHAGLGTAYLSKKQYAAATPYFKHAIALNPQLAEAHYNLGVALIKQNNANDAVISFRQAITLNPQDTHALESLVNTLRTLGQLDKAADVYRQWLALEPDNPIPRHHLAACSQEEIPVRAENAYVENTFDEFAESFDATLEGLNYRGPQLIVESLRRECGDAHKQFAILDAGCGTGLCGPLIISYAAQLAGVDLSARMLERAKLRNVYDVLVKAELTEYLLLQADTFDIILSADTLIYFGALENLFAAARVAIRDNGRLLFTVESFASDRVGGKSALGYCLSPHGRYSHSEAYLRRTLEISGFTILAIETVILRYEYNLPVQGFVVTCRAT